MRLLFNFSEKEEIIIDGNLNEFNFNLLKNIQPQEIYVVVSPGSYLRIRKSLAIVYAICSVFSTRIIGIDILDHMRLFQKNVGFIQKKHLWTYSNNQIVVKSIADCSESLYTNIPTSFSLGLIDCSSLAIWHKLNELPELEPKQKFFDSYMKFNNSLTFSQSE